MDARAVYPIYEVTYDELRGAVDRGDSDLVTEICRRVRALPNGERTAALIALEHVADRKPKRAIDHFAREFGSLASGSR
jgi:hypothetical protein